MKTDALFIALVLTQVSGESCVTHQSLKDGHLAGQNLAAQNDRSPGTPSVDWVLGEWAGEFKLKQRKVHFRISFESEPGRDLKATFTVPLEEVAGRVTQVTVESRHIYLELPYPTKPLSLRGKFEDGKIWGEVQQAEDRGIFEMVHLARVAPNILEQYQGNYELSSDRYVSIGISNELDDRLMYFDSKSRRTGSLNALSETRYFAGPSVIIDYPLDISVTFGRDSRGEVTGLEWRESGSVRIHASKVNPHKHEDVTFRNGDIVLSGTLIKPATNGRHAAIVWIHGAGDKIRTAGIWPYFLVRHGIAVLTYDKRGCGRSTGDWRKASFKDLAGDVLAGVELLKADREIDASHIGVWGTSNGGWVAPLAASRSKDVAFVICQVGSAVPVAQNIEYEVESNLKEFGFTEREVSQGVALRRLLNQTILTNMGWDTLKEAVGKARNEKWFSLTRTSWVLDMKIPPDQATLVGLRNGLDFDPLPVWETITCPVLALFAELDKTVPTPKSFPLLEGALRKAKNRDYTIVVLPKANHWLLEAETGYGSDFARVNKFVAGYLDRVGDWLANRIQEPR